MVKLEAQNPISGKKFNLLNPWIWVLGILFVVFCIIIIGGGKKIVELGKGFVGVGTPAIGEGINKLL